MLQKSNTTCNAQALPFSLPVSLLVALCLSVSSLSSAADVADKTVEGSAATAGKKETAREKLTVLDTAPGRYTVQKGDTLWGIAGKYLKQPWRWPEIWGLNKDQIKNPHRIYPGDVIVLSRLANGDPRLSIEKLSPVVRVSPLPQEQIPSIPPGDLEPYLTRSFISGPEGLVTAGEIIEARDRDRLLRGSNDQVYVVGVTPEQGTRWNIFRPGKPIFDIEGKRLGIEFRYLGVGEVERFGSNPNEASTVRIMNASEEIWIGDRLVAVPRETIVNYVPHAPDKTVEAFIVSSLHDSSEMGRSDIVVIDQGAQQGVEVGHVLAVYRQVAPIADPRPNTATEQIVRGFDQTTWYKKPSMIKVPDERAGLMFVFRVFDTASYAILLNTTDPIKVGDFVRNP